MTRYFKVTGNPADGVRRSEFEKNALDSALEQVSGRIAPADADLLAYEPAVELARRGEAEVEAEPAGVYVTGAAHRLHMDSLRGRLHASGDALARPRPDEDGDSGTAVAGRERPEVERMLETVLDAGDRKIVERLKELDAEIAKAACTGAEVGELIEAYYIPLLLSALALSDEGFDAEYPGEGRVTSEERGELIDAILGHVQDCPRCELKYLSDMEWDAYLEKVRKPKPRPRMRIFA
jgi:hypothetical protein